MRSITLLIVVIACGISVQRESNKEEPSIAIIGAGISGLSAARRLIELGNTNVDIYEGKDRIGGRIHPVPYHGGYLQMGAQFINGANNPIYEIASALGVISDVVSDTAHLDNADYLIGNQNISRMDIELFKNFIKPLDPKYRKIARQQDRLSRVHTIESIYMEDYLRFLKENNITGIRRAVFDALTRSYRAYWECEWAADWADLSLRVLDEFNDGGAGGEAFLTNKHGYKAILDHIKAAIPNHMIHFNTRVLNINYSDSEVTLKTTHGYEKKTYDYVIVTSSLGHLKKFHQELFTPPLPRHKIEAIEKIGFGGSCKIFFRWKRPWWSNKTYSIMPLPVVGMARNTMDKFEGALTTLQVLDWDPNTTIAWVAGAGQTVVDNMSNDEITNRLTSLIRDMKNDQTIDPPVEIIRTRLTKDELLLGSYSYVSLAQVKSRISHSRLSIPLKHNKRVKVLFAGEATHHRMFQTAIGAYLSGRREADRLILDWESRNSVLGRETLCGSVKNFSTQRHDIIDRPPIAGNAQLEKANEVYSEHFAQHIGQEKNTSFIVEVFALNNSYG